MTQESSIATAVDKIIDEADALHGMVVNAGRTKHKPALEFTDEEIEALFSVNVGFWSEVKHAGADMIVIRIILHS